MKRIIAFVRPNMIDNVISALHKVENFPGATMSDATAIVRGVHQKHQVQCEPPRFGHASLVRIELISSEEIVDELVKVIAASADTGRHGDGHISIAPVDADYQIENFSKVLEDA
jgi:nitrogen regulatory protein P-II 1